MVMQLDIEVGVDPPILLLISQFDEASNKIRSLREPLKQCIQQIIAPALRQHFEDEGPGWQELSPERVAVKGHARILYDTGKLERVVGQLNIWKIDGGYSTGEASAAIEQLPGAQYGFVHNTGYPPHHLPQRQWAYIDEGTEDKISDVFTAYVNSVMDSTILNGTPAGSGGFSFCGAVAIATGGATAIVTGVGGGAVGFAGSLDDFSG